ncbi:MAG: hypothetical protein IKE94_06535 [Aeriscardovia sp.]|nr:hypothetical protein [Aeriscardovia sp.]
MAGYIRGITIEFGADTSKLNGALKKTQGTINKTQAELKQINRALKFNPGNTTLLRQKFELLQQSVKETSLKLKQLKDMQKSMDAAGVDKTSAQYRQLEREIVKTESQLKNAQNALKQFGSVGKQQALAVGNAFKTAGNKIKSAGRTITTTMSVYGVAGIYAGSRLIEMSEAQAQAEQKLAEIYKSRMGVGKKAVASTLALASAEQKAGVVGDEVQIAAAQQLATYAKYPGTVNTMLPALNDLLVQQKGLNGTQEDATALANLFGKAMMGQTGALKRAGISFTEAQEEVLKYGTEEEKAAMIAEVVNQNVGQMNEQFAKTDAGKIQQAKNALGDMGEQIGAVLLPAVADLVSWFQANLLPKLQQLINFMQQHPAIAKFALAFAAITAVLGPLIMMIGSLVSAIGTIITIAPALGAAFTFLTGPVGLVIAAIAAAIAIGVALYRNWNTIKAKASSIWNAIKNAIMKPVNAVRNAVRTNFNTLKNNVTSVFTSIKSTASRIWGGIKTAITKPIESAKNTVKGIVNKIKGFFPFKIGKIVSLRTPSISLLTGSKSVLGKTITYPKGFHVSWNKKAMQDPYLFSNATLFGAGEAGDEVLYGRSALMRDIANAVGGGATNTWNITVNGAEEPEAWAAKFAHQFKVQMRLANG